MIDLNSRHSPPCCLLLPQAVCDQSAARPGGPGRHRGPGAGACPGQEDVPAAAEPQQPEEEGRVKETHTHAQKVKYCHMT